MDEEITQLVDKLRSRTEKIGLYMESVAVASPTMVDPQVAAKLDGDAPLKEMLASGEVSLVMMCSFRPGEVAFSDRVVNEKKWRADQEFGAIVPTSKELKYDAIMKKLDEMKDGDDPLAMFDEG